MDLRRHTGSLVPTLARSAALIMAVSREASLLAGTRALAEASMEVGVSTEAAAFTEAEAAVTGNSVQYCGIKR